MTLRGLARLVETDGTEFFFFRSEREKMEREKERRNPLRKAKNGSPDDATTFCLSFFLSSFERERGEEREEEKKTATAVLTFSSLSCPS